MNPASILVADDESNIRLMLRRALESDGYEVREAANGREALQSIGRQAPDVMILDLNMPEVDGMAVLEQMRSGSGRSGPKVIVLTAFGSIRSAVKATRLGAVDFLEKPLLPGDVREAVEAALNEPPGPPGEPGPASGPAIEQLERSVARVLDQVRRSLRLGEHEDAESLLRRVEDMPRTDAAHFNLLGVLYESRRKWRLAKRFYGKAIAIDGKYPPAQQNMRRIYELYTFGASSEPVALGDDTDQPTSLPYARAGRGKP